MSYKEVINKYIREKFNFKGFSNVGRPFRIASKINRVNLKTTLAGFINPSVKHNLTEYVITFISKILDRYVKLSILRVTKKVNHGSIKELLWTIIPAIVLLIIAIPSMRLLYSIDSLVLDSSMIYTYKVIGHQWYWSYEYFTLTDKTGTIDIIDIFENYPEFLGSKFFKEMIKTFSLEVTLFEFSSYMLDEDTVISNFNNNIPYSSGLRLLEVDNPLIVPCLNPIRFLITSADVLHAWAVPSLGIKVDAVPGRLNQVYVEITRPGTFYGQCSEICGVNHGFMPIKVISYFSKLPNMQGWVWD